MRAGRAPRLAVRWLGGTRGCFPGSGVAPVSGNVAGAAETAARGQGMLRDGSGMRMQPSRKEALARMLPSGIPVGTPRSVCVPFSGSSIDAFLFYWAGSPSPQHPACARLLNHGGRKIHTFFNPNALPGWRAALPERWQHATALGGSRAGFVPWGGPRPGLGWGPRSPPQHPSGRS